MAEISADLRDIFAAAAEFESDTAREQFLDHACADNSQLRQEVNELLQAHLSAGSFMHQPTNIRSLTEEPGDLIGPYKLLQQIGEGGMGVVYMAEQTEPVERRVALKIIKPGMDSQQVIARFQAERQALAMMDHPNIARVLDAGTTDSGRPYFVMELVHGIPLTKYCDERRLTLRQRLQLFVPVCQAIQHAHQKGVIHRDIKPSNILVTMYDDKAVPKVIDFGVAKAIEQRLTEKTLFTQYGTLVGTFEYMSPEQAEMNALGVDTRSDIYSLGVLLYELLTDSTPIERSRLREAAFMEMVRLIKEEEPPRPSIRLSTSGGLPKVAAACRTEPDQLPGMIRGELDWIVMKCLEKDRTLRYETANGLARDVERYLHDEPVEACPPSALYRLRKLARKHRGLLATATAFAVLLVVASIVSTGFAVWALRAQHNAEESLEKERIAVDEAVKAKERADLATLRVRNAIQAANEGVAYYNRQSWSAAHEWFSKAAAIETELDTPYLYRAALYLKLGLWDRAEADYDRLFRFATSADPQACFEHALLKLYNGDEAGYREVCEQLLRQHGNTVEIHNRYTVLRTCLLAPQVVGDPKDLLRRAESLVANASSPAHIHAAGRAALKNGDYDLAVNRCLESLKLGNGAPAGVQRVVFTTLALAQYQRGKQQEAESALSQAEQARNDWIDLMSNGLVGTMPIDWWEWLSFEISLREAHELITDKPLGVDERLMAIEQRALAAINYDDVFAFMDAGRAQVKLQSWDQAAAQFVKVLDQLPTDGFQASSQMMRFCVEMVQQPEVFARLVERRPNDHRLWSARGRVRAGEQEWTKAIPDFKRAMELLNVAQQQNPASIDRDRAYAATVNELGALMLLVGDRNGYRTLCQAIVEEQSHTDEEYSASSLSRACTLSPEGQTDWSVPLKLAERAVEQQPKIAWFQFALGLAQYRDNHYEEAVQSLNQSLEVGPNWLARGQNYAVLAMAHQKLGHVQEAGKQLARAHSSFNEMNRTMAKSNFGYAASNYMNDWLFLQILLPEAEQLLEETDNP